MVSMKRMRCGLLCITTELVRMPSPKKRTPFSRSPSVTPVAAKISESDEARSRRGVDPLQIGDAHRLAAGFVLGRPHDQAREDLAVQTAHRRRGQHAFGRAADAHHRVNAAAGHRRGDARRQVAVANQLDARAGRADVGDQLS